ncbi:hypothetical protein LEP1GSC132_2857 [Leptospira kirschneri str. 200803703]|nr:hypothetical protein LEP1GSC044_3671 [Leptospira kirschneri serovar Grippotyphosa str. RM52]EKR06617.1 hypothetical protein LEP1GSC122_1103 [Leptospira kirschneri serovar Valbuzzi str. 200702274]EMK01076.1 hypothetical protein LEP1GSC176_0935 [Leptospira kirschneri str. MMD1493]EMK15761.1 hypothetical protein LEP1GSC042_1735 [Leptospira kirschneri serovar Bim str. PUO 1247]EMN03180.1 hypothetical protein LEP1GSC046_1992 [Leptospira kirschneri serovar Bim str. 1051]EMN26891.1 hypothetical pr
MQELQSCIRNFLKTIVYTLKVLGQLFYKNTDPIKLNT